MQIYRIGGAFYDMLHLSLTMRKEEVLKANSIEGLGLQPGAKVLDWGCGTGLSLRLLYPWLRDGGTIYAVDSSPSMAKRAVACCKPSDVLKYHFLLRDGLDLPIQEEVDVVIASYSLGVLSTDQFDPALQGIWKALKPGGRLLLLDMYVPTEQPWLRRVYQKATISFANKVFRQDFSETLLPAANKYFDTVSISHDEPLMAVTFVGKKRELPLDNSPAQSS
ncbi:class I SAM-dependent methyltransferase [Rosistilla oblonga]|uniref:class I SAM-dependent methyltransferase n=1 Tax=Rosistilla oblonga TaxID=2527990 RepID=UPI003A97890D